MMNYERLMTLLRTADGQAQFISWLGNDMTQLMLAAARELARPIRPGTFDPYEGQFTLGQSVGCNSVVDFLSNPGAALRAEEQARKLAASPRYGSDEILKSNLGQVMAEGGKEE